MITGLAPSCSHPENGMIRTDMEATLRVADRLNEVIAFRSTGPWAKRWIEAGYPTKNFHVKGKSSDWGPQAGLVPYLGVYSKVGASSEKAAAGTKANDKGLKSGFAGKQVLQLTDEMIMTQLQRPEESPPRTAIDSQNVLDGDRRVLFAKRSGDLKVFAFLALRSALKPGYYEIQAIAESAGTNIFKILDPKNRIPLEVMTSGEVGADMPMTGDYDLLAVCPRWADYGSRLVSDVVKPGINLRQGGAQPGQTFHAGVGMDNVLDPRLHTMGAKDWHSYQFRKAGYQARAKAGKTGHLSDDSKKLIFGAEDLSKEHQDMGNLTPRILRCINALNAEMGAVGSKGATRRVHHNAEALRPFLFGAIFGGEMLEQGEGFPFTSFQPSGLRQALGDVCTMINMADFNAWVSELKKAGYYVPKNWAWSQRESPMSKFEQRFGRSPAYLPEKH